MSRHLCVIALLLASSSALAAERPITGKVPLTGPLKEVPDTPQTAIPLFKPNCSWRSERYHHPTEGWITRRRQVCR